MLFLLIYYIKTIGNLFNILFYLILSIDVSKWEGYIDNKSQVFKCIWDFTIRTT